MGKSPQCGCRFLNLRLMPMRFRSAQFKGQAAIRDWSTFLLSTCLMVVAATSGAATTNNWIKPASGDWQDQTGWSLGILPAQDQTIMLTNQGWKAIAIGPAT